MVSPLATRETIRLWEFVRKTFKVDLRKYKNKKDITTLIRRKENILKRRIDGQRTFDKKIDRLSTVKAKKEYNRLKSFRTRAWRKTDLWSNVKAGREETYRKRYGDREIQIIRENINNRDNEDLMWRIYDETGMFRSKKSISVKKSRLRK